MIRAVMKIKFLFYPQGYLSQLNLEFPALGLVLRFIKQVDQFRNLRVRPFFPLLFFLTLPCLNNRLSNPISKMKSLEFPYRAHLV